MCVACLINIEKEKGQLESCPVFENL